MSTPITKELAQRLELAEAEWNLAKLQALMDIDNNARRVEIKRFGNIRAMTTGSHAHNPSYNRAFYVTPDDADKLADVCDWFKAQQVSPWIDIVPPLIDSSVLNALHATNLFLVRFGDTVFADLETTPVQHDVPANVAIVERPPQYFGYAQVLTAAFGIPEHLLSNTANFAQQEHAHPAWRLLLATVEGQPAAIASLYLGEYVASIPAMGTAPAFRRHGLQRLLLEACKTYAKSAGLNLISTQVEPASTSERNTLRAGFQIAYTKAFWGDTVFEY